MKLIVKTGQQPNIIADNQAKLKNLTFTPDELAHDGNVSIVNFSVHISTLCDNWRSGR